MRIKLTPARDPESKGLIERRNGYFETSFLPGRSFVSPFDFNAQIEAWLTGVANARHLRSIGTSPAERLGSRPRRDGRTAAGGADGRADRADPAVPRLLRAHRRQRLLGQPGRDRPVRRLDRHPRPGRGHLRRADRGHPRAGLGQRRHGHRSRAPGHRPRRCAPSSPPPGSGPAHPRPTPTGTSWPCARCRTTTPSSAWTSTPHSDPTTAPIGRRRRRNASTLMTSTRPRPRRRTRTRPSEPSSARSWPT